MFACLDGHVEWPRLRAAHHTHGRRNEIWNGGQLTMANAIARAYNGGPETEPQRESRGQSAQQGVKGEAP